MALVLEEFSSTNNLLIHTNLVNRDNTNLALISSKLVSQHLICIR